MHGSVIVSAAEGLALGTGKTCRVMDQSSVWATFKSVCRGKLKGRSGQQLGGSVAIVAEGG